MDTVSFLRNFNRWRRGDEDITQPDPREIGEAIDAACDEIIRLEKELLNREGQLDEAQRRIESWCDLIKNRR